MGKRTCSQGGCESPHLARGMCSKHWQRWRRHGDPQWEPLDVTDRFWSKVDRSGDCWTWLGGIADNGYGQFQAGVGRGAPNVGAHRYAWEITHGPIGPSDVVCHHCDNRACVRPDHLFLGTHGDNMDDMTRKGRQARGTRHAAAKLTEETVALVRAEYAAGAKQRDLAAKYGVSQRAICKAVRRETWRHV